LNIGDPVWDHSTFSFNRQRVVDEAIAQHYFEHTVLLARLHDLVSDENFSVDGTLLEAWASHKSFRCVHRSDCITQPISIDQAVDQYDQPWTGRERPESDLEAT
jgi:hypothetical protein